MAWLNASGNPVKMAPVTIQLDLPAEQSVNVGTPNWAAVLGAGIQLMLAMMTGNSAGIAAAIQALISAFMGV
jgi:hypothetical protein